MATVVYVTPADLRQNDSISDAIRNLSEFAVVDALKQASSLADSYVSNRYDVPFLTYGDDFKRAVRDIAIYDLISTRGLSLRGDDENFRLRYKDAIDWLTKVNKGIITPDGLAGGGTGTGPGGVGGGSGTGSSSGRGYGAIRFTTSRRRGW